jgi:hypothetical protein
MSIDMFVFTVSMTEEDGFPREIVERAFAPYAEEMKDGSYCLHLKSGEEFGGYMSLHGAELISSVSINRPPNYAYFPEFWDALYDVMRQTPTFCFAVLGSTHTYCVANPDAVDKLPADLPGKLGETRLVSSGAELEKAVSE